jgi:hypothetical protein
VKALCSFTLNVSLLVAAAYLAGTGHLWWCGLALLFVLEREVRS